MKAVKVWEGNFVRIEVPKDIYEWPAHRKEIQNRAGELEELIYSIVTGAIERWQ